MLSLIIPAFIAGLLTFLAPCTLPLVPGYLSFISGVSAKDFQDPKKAEQARKKVFHNGFLYVLGFTLVFIFFGIAFTFVGSTLSEYRMWLSRMGGVFIIFFGLYLLHIFKLPIFNFLSREKRPFLLSQVTPGKPSSSFLFGASFAFGWTPCVGPVLGSVLILTASKATVVEGGMLLGIFSLGLAFPFLLLAYGIGHAFEYVQRISKYLRVFSVVGGAFLVFLGVLLVTENFSLWVSSFYDWFSFLNAERLLDYL